MGRYQTAFNNDIFYMVTNKHETYYDYKFKDGINTIPGEFNCDETSIGISRGFCFTTKDNIYKFINNGIFIREIFLPFRDPNFKMIVDITGDKFRSNKVILSTRHKIENTQTITKLYLNEYPNELCNWAIQYNRIPVLELLKNANYDFNRNREIISLISIYGHLNILIWFYRNGFHFDSQSIDNAIILSHVNKNFRIIDWLNDNFNELYINSMYVDPFDKYNKLYNFIDISIKRDILY